MSIYDYSAINKAGQRTNPRKGLLEFRPISGRSGVVKRAIAENK